MYSIQTVPGFLMVEHQYLLQIKNHTTYYLMATPTVVGLQFCSYVYSIVTTKLPIDRPQFHQQYIQLKITRILKQQAKC